MLKAIHFWNIKLNSICEMAQMKTGFINRFYCILKSDLQHLNYSNFILWLWLHLYHSKSVLNDSNEIGEIFLKMILCLGVWNNITATYISEAVLNVCPDNCTGTNIRFIFIFVPIIPKNKFHKQITLIRSRLRFLMLRFVPIALPINALIYGIYTTV